MLWNMSTRFRPPQQHRSQETLDRILDAAEQVLDAKSFSEATLAEIMERAGVTVGAFYRRFPDKDALLHLLDERFFSELYARADATLDPSLWNNAPLSAIVAGFVAQAAELYRARRGLLRSLFLRARTDPLIADSARRANAHLIEKLSALLMQRAGEIRHPDPRRAIELGFMVIVGALREMLLFGEVWPSPNATTHADIAAELSRVYLAYLTA
jgi:AcrR family transcriptional regulator